MPLPRKSYKDTKALAKSSATPPVTAPVDENGNVRAMASPTMPPPKSNVGKDARAYEHERQRLKKAADFVKMRARKTQGAGWAGNKPHQRSASLSASTTPSEKGRRLRDEDDLEDDVEGLVLSDSWKENMGVVPLVAEVESPSRYEVRLADLIQTGKPRKPKGDGDFEVIPHIRSVIVLDDNTPDEFDVDEPWEHVLNPDNEVNKGPSYAEVAALAK